MSQFDPERRKRYPGKVGPAGARPEQLVKVGVERRPGFLSRCSAASAEGAGRVSRYG